MRIIISLFAAILLGSRAQVAESPLDRLSQYDRNFVTDRARDLYILPNEIRIDAWRINRIRDALKPGEWSEIDAGQCRLLGVGHTQNADRRHIQVTGPHAPLQGEYDSLIPLVAIRQGDIEKIKGWVLFIDIPTIRSLRPAIANREEWIATPPHVVRVQQVWDDANVLARVGHYKNSQPPSPIPEGDIHVCGDVAGLIDDQVIPGDFFLVPAGRKSFETGLGTQRTVASFELRRLGDPMKPEELAAAVESGELTLERHSTQSQRKREGNQYSTKSVPVQLRFHAALPDPK